MPQNKLLTVTNIILLVNLIIFFMKDLIPHLDVLLGLNLLFFDLHLYYQLLSTMFVHSGVSHILMNMFILFQFGNIIEASIGKIRFSLLYFIGGILTSIGSLWYLMFTSNLAQTNLVGASGAISVLLGWIALRDKTQRGGIVVWIMLISFAPLFLGLPVAWYSHLIGFVLGWIMGYVI